MKEVFLLVWTIDDLASILGAYETEEEAKEALDEVSGDEDQPWKDWDYIKIKKMPVGKFYEVEICE